jgi:anion-transporting  ArsA/GET3 family ATPase
VIELPRITFVMGKGGVGRSTVAAALALARAERGDRVLVYQWAANDVIAPWFGRPACGAAPVAVAPGLAVANYALDETLRAYFVDHLHLGFLYRRVIRARSVARTIDVAPGLAEIFFLGQLWWLITLAEREAGYRFDRVVVDTPATGHGASIFEMPALLSSMGPAGLLELEMKRVTEMLADPARTGAIVVGLPEPLVVDETLELVPRIGERLGRAPLALIVNRSASAIAPAEPRPPWLGEHPALIALCDELRERALVERGLCERAGIARCAAIDERPGLPPLAVVRAAAHALAEAV